MYVSDWCAFLICVKFLKITSSYLTPRAVCVCLMSLAGRFWAWKCVLGMLSC